MGACPPPPTGTPTPPGPRDVLPLRSPLDDVPTHATDIHRSARGRLRASMAALVLTILAVAVARASRRLAQPHGDPAARRPARDRSRAHPRRRPARRRAGDPLLSAGHHRDEARASVDDNHVKAKLKIAPDCRARRARPAAPHRHRHQRAAHFSVGALPGVDEAEPNNDFAKPQQIALNVDRHRRRRQRGRRLLRGRGQEGRADHRRGRGHAAGGHALRPLRRDPGRQAVRAGLQRRRRPGLAGRRSPRSSPPRTASTSSRSARAPTPATAPASTGCTSATSPGRPRPSPPAASPARRSSVSWIGDVAGEKTTEVDPARRAPCATSASSPQDEQGIAPYPNTFRLSPFGNVLEAEPNDDQATATPFTPPLALNGVIDKPGDVDHFMFKAKKGQVFDVRVFARAPPVAARPGPVRRQEGRRRTSPATTTAAARTATSASPPRRTASTSSGSTTTCTRAGRLLLPDRGDARSSRA